MPVKVKDIVRWMEAWAPPSFAEPDDKIGLQVGSMSAPVTRIAVALDVTQAVVKEAADQGAELIVAHHPILFRPMQAIRTDQPDGQLIQMLLQHQISVFAAHTNLDVAPGGVNDLLADALGLNNCKPLKTTGTDPLYKVAAYVPGSHMEAVQNAVFAAGAGHIGKYSRCGFTVEGMGTFLPESGASPFIGEPGRLERVREGRFETIVPASRKPAVIEAMKRAHPYEEVSYDVYRVERSGQPYGLGRIGTLPAAMPLRDFAEHAKTAFGVPRLRYVGDDARSVRKVAVLGGSGRSYVKHALAAGADVFVTGDLDHHTSHDAWAAGLALVDPGHHIEQIMKHGVADRLRERAASERAGVDVYASGLSTEPFTFL
jgi:dinuclear metal center YbgI/SA1388 family protein